MEKLVTLLKKIFTVNVLALLVSCIAAWFAYDQYNRANSGKVTAYLMDREVPTDFYNVVLCTTGDSINIKWPHYYVRFKNSSNYALPNFRIKYKIHESIFQTQNPPMEFSFWEDGLDDNGFHTDETSLTNVFEFSHKCATFYPEDYTPIFVNRNTVQKSDTIRTGIYRIDAIVSWDGQEPLQYTTILNLYIIPDSVKPEDNNADILNDPDYQTWAGKVGKSVSSSFHGQEPFDLILGYHIQEDSISASGYKAHLHNFHIGDFSQLSKDADFDFLREHAVFFKQASKDVTFCENCYIAFFVCWVAFFYLIFVGNKFKRAEFRKASLFDKLLTISLPIFVVSGIYIAGHTNYYLQFWLDHINLILFSSAVAIIYTILFSLRVIIEWIKELPRSAKNIGGTILCLFYLGGAIYICVCLVKLMEHYSLLLN